MNLAGQRVLVVGAAKSGIAAARFLMARGAVVTISDRRPLEEMGEARSLGALLETGGHNLETFLDQDAVVLSPGVSATLPAVVAARQKGIPVMAEAELASRFLRGRLVGITGSNGKTTTTALTGKLFEAAGFHTQVGGNIGTPLVSLVDTSRADTINVVELSSFQLETIQQLRPTVAVVLNVTPDHLDRHGSMEAYAAAKGRLFENQTPQDFAVLNADDATCRRYAESTRAQVLLFSRLHGVAAGASVEDGDLIYSAGAYSFTVMPADEIPLKGGHNVENVLAALCAALALDANPQALRKGVREFKAVEHRLEFVVRVQDVDYYNDSKATNVDATVKSLEAFEGKVLVILGGLDKGSDYTTLIPLLKKKARVALLIGSAADKIAGHLGDAVPLVRAETLEVAVRAAATHARPGDTVLLAPACASFDQFRNFEHRGEVFKETREETRLNHKDTKDTKTAADELSHVIIGAAIEVHKHLGPGLLESAYEQCLCRELALRGIRFERQVQLPIEYKGVKLDCGYRLDLVVENLVIVEIKAVEKIEPVHEAQLLTYLRLRGLWLGLLINFNVPHLKDGVRRFVLG